MENDTKGGEDARRAFWDNSIRTRVGDAWQLFPDTSLISRQVKMRSLNPLVYYARHFLSHAVSGSGPTDVAMKFPKSSASAKKGYSQVSFFVKNKPPKNIANPAVKTKMAGRAQPIARRQDMPNATNGVKMNKNSGVKTQVSRIKGSKGAQNSLQFNNEYTVNKPQVPYSPSPSTNLPIAGKNLAKNYKPQVIPV